MDWVPLAEAGLSDCAKSDMNCMPGFGQFLLLAGLAVVGLILWLSVLMGITLAIAESSETIPRKLVWALFVWFVPLVGAIAWFARRTSLRGL
ncbi:MAG: hypothetical protein GX610_14250 [Rhodococcus sp.]|nr:hypothetical protein [Rhodococcus sp. (in: high G+C Gram-positive bacteria)]